MKKVLVFICAGTLLFSACGSSGNGSSDDYNRHKTEAELQKELKNAEQDNSLINSEQKSANKNEPKLLKVSGVSYGNSLKPQSGNTYEAINLCDGDLSTVWAVDLNNPTIYECDQLYGPTVKINCKKLSHIVVWNGYGKNETSFKNNSRAARIRFLCYDENDNENILVEGELKDVSSPQTIKIPDIAGNNDITELWIVFDTEINGGIYKGNKWNDLCISEIEFWGFE